MNKRFSSLFLLVFLLLGALTIRANAEEYNWTQQSGIWYCYEGDTMLTSRWVYTEDNWYYLDQTGSMVTDTWIFYENRWYYLDAYGRMTTGWQKVVDQWYYMDAKGRMTTGWQKVDGQWYYMDAKGHMTTGWQKVDGQWYYMDAKGRMAANKWIIYENNWYYLQGNGAMVTGWQTVSGESRYFLPTGAAAKGSHSVAGKTLQFSSAGIPILLVNPWNKIPSDYQVELTTVGGYSVSTDCAQSLRKMLADCEAAGHGAYICSGYRSSSTQTYLYNRKVNYYLGRGYSESVARKLASQSVAIPGTSEHQLGLAVDIVDENYGSLDAHQAQMPAQKWLMANCWRYGFILRYPEGSSESTGIIYEPWHYRYVGKEIAGEIHRSGLCMEDYLSALTSGELFQ